MNDRQILAGLRRLARADDAGEIALALEAELEARLRAELPRMIVAPLWRMVLAAARRPGTLARWRGR